MRMMRSIKQFGDCAKSCPDSGLAVVDRGFAAVGPSHYQSRENVIHKVEVNKSKTRTPGNSCISGDGLLARSKCDGSVVLCRGVSVHTPCGTASSPGTGGTGCWLYRS